jgi:Leucine-rich repeat (LRR) protein
MEIKNPNGNEFSEIEGDHVDELDDGDVTDLIISNQLTSNVPKIICEKFKNLKVFSAVSSEIQTLTENSFESCENLEILSLASNLISEIPENSFVNLQKLYEINFSVNQLTKISQKAFSDSVLENLLNVYLQNNQINAIDINFFDGAENLRILFLSGNLCAQFNFNDVSLFRDAVRQLLMGCFMNYQKKDLIE